MTAQPAEKLNDVFNGVFVTSRIEDEDGWRWYVLNTGDKLISLTKSQDHIVPEKRQLSMKKTSFNAQEKFRKYTADIGTEIGALCEADLMGQKVEITNELHKKPFENWLKMKEAHKITGILTQKAVHSIKYGYAGTLDIFGNFTSCSDPQCCAYPFDGLSVMDIKSGRVTEKAAQQESGYAQALEEMCGYTKLGLITLNVHRDGLVVKPFVTQHYEFVFRHFLYTLETFKSVYFGKLNKMNWKWLKQDAAEIYFRDKWGIEANELSDHEKYGVSKFDKMD